MVKLGKKVIESRCFCILIQLYFPDHCYRLVLCGSIDNGCFANKFFGEYLAPLFKLPLLFFESLGLGEDFFTRVRHEALIDKHLKESAKEIASAHSWLKVRRRNRKLNVRNIFF